MPTPAALTAAIDARLPLVGERGIESVEGRPHELIATSIVSSRFSTPAGELRWPAARASRLPWFPQL